MAAITDTEFPESYQKNYTTVGRPFRIGDRIGVDPYNDKTVRGNIPVRVVKPQITTATAVANSGDTVGLTIDGGDFSVTSPVTNAQLAIDEAARLEGAPLLDTVLAAVPAGDDVVITFADNEPHTVTSISPAVADFTPIVTTQAAVANEKILPGMAVVRAAEGPGFIARPSALGQRVVAVVLRKPAQIKPDNQARIAGFDPLYLQPGDAFDAVAEGQGRVAYIGTAPDLTNGPIPVYVIKTGQNRGLFATSSGAVKKVVTLTVTSVADGNVGFSYDGETALALAATGSATNDATSLHGQFIGSPAYMALVDGGSTTSVVDNLDGTITITFAEGVNPTFADASTGTSTVAEGVDTAFVAANAELEERIVFDADFGGGEARITIGLIA